MIKHPFLATGLALALGCGVAVAAGLEGPTSGGTVGDATAAKQDTSNTNIGAPGETSCATDTSSCSLNALLQHVAVRLTSIYTTLGSPSQAPATEPCAGARTFVAGATAAITDTTSTSVIASAGGSLRNCVTAVIVSNSHATVGTFVKILDGSTIVWEGYAAAVGGGFSSTFPIPLRGTAATAINCQPVTTGANVICSAQGYTGT